MPEFHVLLHGMCWPVEFVRTERDGEIVVLESIPPYAGGPDRCLIPEHQVDDFDAAPGAGAGDGQ